MLTIKGYAVIVICNLYPRGYVTENVTYGKHGLFDYAKDARKRALAIRDEKRKDQDPEEKCYIKPSTVQVDIPEAGRTKETE